MNCNTQNAKIASITEKTLIVGIDVGSETHFARAFDWRNYEYTKKPLEFSNTEAGFMMFKAWVEDIAEKQGKTAVIPGMEPTGHYWFALGKFLQDSGMKPVHVSNLRFQTQEELTRIKNRIARWFAIYFPEYKDVYGDLMAVSGRMILKEAPLPEDIRILGVNGVNQIWRNAKLRGTGMKRAKILVSAAEHSVGSKEASEAARIELKNLLNDMDVYVSRMEELLQTIEEKLKTIPYVDKLMEIKGIGLITVSGFIAEVGDIGRFDNPKQLQKLAGYAIVANDSGKHNGESRISYRGRKRLRYVLYEAAISLVGKNAEFKEIHEYYRTRKENPLKKMQSVVAVACKIIRVFYTILTKGVDYDPMKLMSDIRRPQLQAA